MPPCGRKKARPTRGQGYSFQLILSKRSGQTSRTHHDRSGRAPFDCVLTLSTNCQAQTVTGLVLKLFPNIWRGRFTYRSASYWHLLAQAFDTEIATYCPKAPRSRDLSLFTKADRQVDVTATTRMKDTERLNRFAVIIYYVLRLSYTGAHMERLTVPPP